MMERMLEHIQEIKSHHSSRRSSRHSTRESPPAISSEAHEPSEDPSVRPIDSQDQISDPIPSSWIQSIVLSPTFKSTISTRTDERGQSLEDALAKSKADRLARVNIQGDEPQSPTSIASKYHEETAPASMKYLNNTFQRFLHYMSLHSHEPGDPLEQPAPRAPRTHSLSGDEPRFSVRDPNGSRPNTTSMNMVSPNMISTNPDISRSNPPQAR